MIAAAKPGLPINELYHTAYDYVKEMFPCYRRGHQGHSISMGQLRRLTSMLPRQDLWRQE